MSVNWNNKNEVIAEIPNMYYMNLRYLSDELKDDKDVMYAAVKSNPNSFEFASDRLKDDEQLAIMAVSNGMGHLFKFVSERLKDNSSVVLAAVSRTFLVFFFHSSMIG